MPSALEISTFTQSVTRSALDQLIRFIESSPSTYDTVCDAHEAIALAMTEEMDAPRAVSHERIAAYDLITAALSELHPSWGNEPDESA